MERNTRVWWGIGIGVAALLIAWIWWINTPAHAQTTKDCLPEEQMPYTQIEGSGLFSLFMLPGMLAVGSMGAAASPEWSCTTGIAVRDAAGAVLKVRKIRDRGQVEPY